MKIPVEFNALSELPDGWSWQPLQSLTANPKQDVVDGPFGSNLKASEYVSAGVPIARLQNIDRNTFVTKNIRFLTPVKAAELARHEFKPDDILITKLGDPLGKACIVPASIGRGVIVADLVRVRPDEKLVDRKYLTYAINSPTLVKQFELHTKGTTRPRVNLSVLRQLPIPLAPRKIQTDIVAEIEKQFSRLDEAVANLQRVKANLKRYKASVLKDAVEGRLVPTEAELARREGRSFETGEQLLQRIEGEQRRAWKGKGPFKSLGPPTALPLPDLPPGWIWATANQICGQITDGEHIQPRYQQVGQPMLTAKNVRDGYVTFDNAGLIAEIDFQNCLKRCAPIEGDILIVSVGATTGRSAIVGPTKPFALVRSVLLLKPLIPSRYLLSVIQSSTCQTYIQRASGSTAQAHLYIKDTRTLPIPIPPLAEQERIVAEVDRRLSLVQGVELAVDADLKRAQGLRQSVLSKSFMVS